MYFPKLLLDLWRLVCINPVTQGIADSADKVGAITSHSSDAGNEPSVEFRDPETLKRDMLFFVRRRDFYGARNLLARQHPAMVSTRVEAYLTGQDYSQKNYEGLAKFLEKQKGEVEKKYTSTSLRMHLPLPPEDVDHKNVSNVLMAYATYEEIIRLYIKDRRYTNASPYAKYASILSKLLSDRKCA